MGVGEDDVIGDFLAGGDEGQRHERQRRLHGFLGQRGVAVTLLRPSGTAEFDGVRLPIVSDGEFVPPGTSVQVVTMQGNRIVVRPE